MAPDRKCGSCEPGDCCKDLSTQNLYLEEPNDDHAHDMADNGCVGPASANNRALRHAIRWRTTQDKSSNKFIEIRKAKLLHSVRRKDAKGVKIQLQELRKSKDACAHGHAGGVSCTSGSLDDYTRGVSGASSILDPTRVEDEYAVSVLEHAVRSGSIEVLNELLAVCDTRDERLNAIDRAMLFAIKYNNIDMCRFIVRLHKAEGACRREQKENQRLSESDEFPLPKEVQVSLRLRQRKWSQPRTLSCLSLIDESEFSQEMTPIVMAAQLERTEIIRLLIDECCPDIHPLTETPIGEHSRATCYVCKEQAHFVGRQTVEECRKAIEVYKALSSPAYIFQAGVTDPILEAFVISDIMEKRKIVDPAFVEKYDIISQRCKKLAMDLLGLCRTTEEISALLGYNGGIDKIHAKYHKAHYSRLMVATFYNQKEFIAHANCQQMLHNVWCEGLPSWVCSHKYQIARIVLYFIFLALTLPVILTLYMFRVPHVNRFVRPPVSKFMFDVISYITFLVLLFANTSEKSMHERGAPPTAIEITIMVWVAGYTVRFIRVLHRRRCWFIQNYDQSRSAMYQLISIALFWVYFLLKIGLYAENKLKGDHATGEGRMTWRWFDPFLWCEVFYAIASAISVINLYTFFKASSTLGPLMISLKSMISDVLRFLILFIVVQSAFSIALTTLYTGYAGLQNEARGFSGLGDTYKILFWDLFGYGDPADVEVRLAVANSTTGELLDVGHRLTEWMGFGFYGFYHMFVIVVLLNMLIAMMANSYNVVVQNSTTEWRFARTRLILSYMNELGVLVPPFNLLPIRFLLGLITKRIDRCRSEPVHTNCLFPKSYKSVMDMVAKRYWREHEANMEDRDRNIGFKSARSKRTSKA